MVVIWDSKSNINISNNEFWALDEYYEVAKKCIGYFAYGDLARRMLNDEDAISFIAERLMYATSEWKPGCGRTLRSFLNQSAQWGVIAWVKMLKRSNKHGCYSLNSEYEDSCMALYEITADPKALPPDEIMSTQEAHNNLLDVIDNSGLTDIQRSYITSVFIDGERPSDVAKKMKVSRQAVDQGIKLAKEKLGLTLYEQVFD